MSRYLCVNALDWDRFQPLLDESLADLKPTDRDALLLRFFENHAFSEIGRRLALSEDAARMRVERALDKLRALLQRRGFASTSAVLTLALTTQSTAAIPTGLVATISASAIASASLSSGLLASTAKIFLMTKVQLTAASGLLLLLLTATLWQTHRQHQTQRALTTATALNDKLAATSRSLQTQLQLAGVAYSTSAPTLTSAERARKDRVIASFTSVLDRQYSALFRHLRLSPTDLIALKDLLIERQTGSFEAYTFALNLKEGLAKPTHHEIGQLVTASQALIEAKIRVLLGEDAFAYFQNYERSAPNRNSLGPFIKDLRALSMPLSDPQQDQLIDLVYQHTQGSPGYPILPDAALESARSFLSPEQFAEFAAMRDINVIRQRRNELNRAAALAGKLTLTSQSAKDYPTSRADSSP